LLYNKKSKPMKNILPIIGLLFGILPVYGQIEQEVRKRNGERDVEAIDNIDSIRFDVESSLMEIVRREGGVKVYELGEVLEVGFVESQSDSLYRPGTVHCDPANPTAVVDVLNPVTGKTWMDRNLGASRVATSSTDEQAYGDLYQWGRLADGHQCRTSPTTTQLSSSDVPGHGDFILAPNSPADWRRPQNGNLWQGVNGVNNPCPIGYRLPTEFELNAERLSWSSDNAAGAFASPLKLSLAGYRSRSNGSLRNVGTYGYYWSSTVSSTNSRNLYFNSSNASMFSSFRANGASVRCLKD
jgi:uncharacterized protein (TIGR02145 family)